MKTKSVTMYCNRCYTCAYSDCDPETCADFHDCYDWEEFYHKDGSVKEDDSCIFMDNGIIAAEGSSKEIFEQTHNARLQSFLSSFYGASA